MRLAPIRTALVIILALLGSAAILAFLVMTTNLLAVHTQSVSDVLPAQDTLLLLTNPTPEDLALFTQWFPVLQEAPLREGIEGVAVINTPDDNQASVVLLRSNRPLGQDSKTISLPPFFAHVSDIAAIPILQNRIGTLTRYGPYHALRTAATNDTSWIYATTDAFKTTDQTFGNAIAKLLIQDATHMGYIRKDSGTRLNFYKPQEYRSIRNITVHPPKDVHTSIALADINEWWKQLADMLPEDKGMILPALLQQWTETTIGPSISWTYDLLPLMEENGIFLMDKNASGALVVALGGHRKSNREAAALSAALQDARQQMYPQYEIRERLFDNRFPAKDIRMSPKQRNAALIKWRRWPIEISADAHLFTAQHGRAVVVGTDETLLKKAIEALETSPNIPSGATTLGAFHTIATGTFENDQFKTLLLNTTGWKLGSLPMPLPVSEGRIRWKLLQQGNIRTLEIDNL